MENLEKAFDMICHDCGGYLGGGNPIVTVKAFLATDPSDESHGAITEAHCLKADAFLRKLDEDILIEFCIGDQDAAEFVLQDLPDFSITAVVLGEYFQTIAA